MMVTRQETLETVRRNLGQCAADLVCIKSLTSPYAVDINAAISLLEIARTLGPEESAEHQLAIADAELKWEGSGKGRIECIKQLMEF